MKNQISYLFALIFTLMLYGCSKENSISSLDDNQIGNQIENQQINPLTISNHCVSNTFDNQTLEGELALSIIETSIDFFDALVTSSLVYTDFEDRIEQIDSVLLIFSGDTLELAEIAILFHSHLGIDSLVTLEYWANLAANKNFVIDSSNKVLLESAMIHYLCSLSATTSSNSVESRAIFKTVAKWLGAGCSMQVFLGVIDTAIMGAGTVLGAGATFGVWGYIGGTATLVYHADNVRDAINCFEL